MAHNRKHTDRDAFPDTPRNIRLDAGLKLRELTELTGISTNGLSRIETGARNPTAFTLALFYAGCGRADLISPLMHVLDGGKQGRVYDVFEAWEAAYGPHTPHGQAHFRTSVRLMKIYGVSPL